MKVCALISFVSPAGSAAAGEVVDVTPEQARAWITAGLVKPVADEPETATRQAPETAVTRKGRR